MDISIKDKYSIQHQIDHVDFDFYDSETIKKTSIVEVTNVRAYDNFQIPNKGGVHDPAMGVSPYDHNGKCVTCGYNAESCTGHFGHINLSVAVYNPFLLKQITKILNAKCFNCHKLKFHKKERNYIFMKLILTKLGLIEEAKSLQGILYMSMLDSTEKLNAKVEEFLGNFKYLVSDDEEDIAGNSNYNSNEHSNLRHSSFDDTNITDETFNTNSTAVGKGKKKKKEISEEDILDEQERNERIAQFKESMYNAKVHKLEEIFEKIKTVNSQIAKDMGRDKELVTTPNVNSITFLKKLELEFWSMLKMNKCCHCHASSLRIKKLNNVKFYSLPLSVKAKKQMTKAGINPDKDALEDGEAEKVKKQTKSKENKKKKKVEQELKSETQKLKDKRNESESDSDASIKEEPNVGSEGIKFLHLFEVQEQIRKLWERDGDLLSVFFGNLVRERTGDLSFKISSSAPGMFFIDTLVVSPNRFRPESSGGGSGGDRSSYLHHHSASYIKILNISNEIRELSKHLNDAPRENEEEKPEDNYGKDFLLDTNRITSKKNSLPFEDLMVKWIKLQDTVNTLFDSQKALSSKDREGKGIRQILEKKGGIYRMKMMGKRVNFAGRTVISPDPMISASEVGVPLMIASKLYIAEPVTKFNIERMRELVRNGPLKYPGAMMIQTEEGRTMSLANMKEEFRLNTLLPKLAEGQIVYRHLQTGDALLVNRQPTLHKPSIMGHRAKVLKGEKTFRLHYSNCNSYNADFDGDEMNIYFLQNHIAREEAYRIANTDNQYIVPTSGKPIRGLIQDSIVGAVYLTLKDSFFTREEYMQLIYASLNGSKVKKIVTVEPAVYKPKLLYTGKQVVTTILKSLTAGKPEINFEHNCKLGGELYPTGNELEGVVTIRGNELLTGVLDKNHIGNSEFGVFHSFYEIYGGEMTGNLITIFGKLFIEYLQSHHGFTCGVADILLNQENNFKRRKDIENILQNGMESLAKFFDMQDFKLEFDNYSRRSVLVRNCNKEELEKLKLLPKEREQIEKLIELQNLKQENLFNPNESENDASIKTLRDKYYETNLKDDSIENNIDTVVKNAVNTQTSSHSRNWLSKGLIHTFPRNYFSMMVLSGAKGSTVNHSLITCMLGQQELEGKRVPKMASGRTLPSFDRFDPNPRAGGYVTDRFSTGIRPQEYFFHCMAGREGLIDTAVKTSRSGYMQRCLIKHLEQLMVNYDYTVRDTDGNVIQFLYGEDAVDVMNTKYLNNFKFISNNIDTYLSKYKPERLEGVIDTHTIRKEKSNIDGEKETLLNKYPPSKYLGSTSDKIYKDMIKFINDDPNKVFKHNDENRKIQPIAMPKVSRSVFKNVVNLKYLNSLVHPGESVGILAAQSIGEPSTQMTLNTFHLAGHGGANVTLGIPRLREILMTSEDNIKTPIMVLPLFSQNLDNVKKLARNFEKYSLIDIAKWVKIKHSMKIIKGEKYRTYYVCLALEEMNNIEEYFGYDWKTVLRILKVYFIPHLAKNLARVLRAGSKKGEIYAQKADDVQVNANEDDLDNTIEENEEDDGEKENESEEESNSEEKEEMNEIEGTTNEEDEDENEHKETMKDKEAGDNQSEVEGESMDVDDDKHEDTASDAHEDTAEDEDKTKQKKDKEKEMLNLKSYSWDNIHIENMEFINIEDKCEFNFEIYFPYKQKNILVKNILDQVMKKINFKSIPGIKRCHILDRKKEGDTKEFILQLEGFNFSEIVKFSDDIDLNRLGTNDIGNILRLYGIEACRASIVKEIVNVFDSYHINVDKRHLGLIADYITYQGVYRSFNRKGLSYSSSPWLKMTFETTMEYLIDSCMSKEMDNCHTPSAKIILGQVPKCGTGAFSIMQNLVK